eukprot:scaffold10140_cov130-Isochrysis_galbana.AAC.2
MDSPPSRGTVLRVRAHPALPLLATALLRPARLVHLLSQARPNQRGQHQGVRQGARLPQVRFWNRDTAEIDCPRCDSGIGTELN